MANQLADDPYDLARYVSAQQPVYAQVCAELAAARKQTHWMWFIFPQLQDLGSSPTAKHYGISSLAEARAYLAHRLLGARLRECTALVNGLQAATAEAIFGYPDYLKFRSCMTLFAYAAAECTGAEPARGTDPFSAALERYYAGEADPLTVRLLRACGTSG
jgi:uncharacterized protein (DUF1810 family)